jgi:type II secretion system protein N
VKVPKQMLFYTTITLWGLIVMVVVVLLFFPYQKALKIASQNVLGAGKMIVSLEGVSLGFMSAEASKIVVGHAAVDGKPLFELRKIHVRWYPLSLLTGRLNILSKAAAYDGVVECIIEGIPVIATASPRMSIKFTNVNLAKYPEGTLPWFKGISGNMSGWIRKEVPLGRLDKQKGSFRIAMSAGEVREIQVKNLPNLVLGYKEVVAEGRIAGSIVHLDKILVEGDGVSLKGRGTIDRGQPEQKINLTLVCESSSNTSPLANGAVITVTGNQWSPTIAISSEPAPQAEKTVARGHAFEMRPSL